MGTKHSLKPIEALFRDTSNFPGSTTLAPLQPQPISNFEPPSKHTSFPPLPEINKWVITDDGGETLRIDFEEPAPRRPLIERKPVINQKPIVLPTHTETETETKTPHSQENNTVYPSYALGEIRSKKQARKIIDARDCSREPCNHCMHLGLKCFRHYQYRVCAFCRSNNWGREECCAGGEEGGEGYVGGGNGDGRVESANKERVEEKEGGSGQRYWWT